MRRWGQIDTDRPDSWYDGVARSVYRPDIYLTAAKMLVEEGMIEEADIPWNTDGYREPTAEFIDGIAYDGASPTPTSTASPSASSRARPSRAPRSSPPTRKSGRRAVRGGLGLHARTNA